jgi:hypothetical protein
MDDDAVRRAIAQRVLDQLDELLPQMGATYQAEVEEYARLTSEQLEHEVLRTSRKIVEEFFGRLSAGRDTSKVDLSDLSRAGRRRLEMGITLDSAMHAFRLAGRETWKAVVAAVRPGEETAVAELAAGWIDYMDRASSSFADGYVAASHERLRRLDARRSAIVDALLEARDWGEVAAVAARYSLALAPRYRPVLLAGEDVLVRIDLMLQQAPADTLAGRRGDRVLALLPDLEADPKHLAKSAHAQLATYGRPVAPGPELLAEVRHIDATLDTAAGAGHLDGVFGPDDLLLEQLLAGNDRVATSFAGRVLDPLVAEVKRRFRTFNDSLKFVIVTAKLLTAQPGAGVPSAIARDDRDACLGVQHSAGRLAKGAVVVVPGADCGEQPITPADLFLSEVPGVDDRREDLEHPGQRATLHDLDASSREALVRRGLLVLFGDEPLSSEEEL